MTATALPIISDITGAGVTEAGFKTQITNLLASLREQGYPLGSNGRIQNLGLSFAVASSALTCTLKQYDGSTAPTSTNPVTAPVRSSSASSGSFNVRNATGALTLTISSGSTLGHANSVASPIYWYLIDNSGTLELAASTKFFGEQGIVSTTAEGGAGAADSATTMYSTNVRSGVAFICIGRSVDTQSTAGTWASTPSEIYLAPFPARVMRAESSVTTAGADIPYSFDGDEDTGMYRKAANTLAWAAGGSEAMSLSSSGLSAADCTGGWVATQAEMESAASPQRIVTPARQHFHPGMAKAWVYFNGSGGASIAASYNVSGIVRNGAGDYTISFTTAFSSANYAAIGMAGLGGGTGQNVRISVLATGSVRIVTTNAANSAPTDADIICVVCFGDQ